MSREKIVLFSEKEIICDEIKRNDIRDSWKIKFDNVISELDFNKSCLIVKFDTDKENSIGMGNNIEIYNISSGKKLGEFRIKKKIDFMRLDKEINNILLGSLNSFFILDLSGKIIFSYNLAGEYKKACLFNKPDEILFLSSDKIFIKEIKKEKHNVNLWRN